MPVAEWPGFPIRIGNVVLCIRQCTEKGLEQGAYRMEGVYDTMAVANYIKSLCYATYGFKIDDNEYVIANLCKFFATVDNLKMPGPYTIQVYPKENLPDANGELCILGFAKLFPWVGEVPELAGAGSVEDSTNECKEKLTEIKSLVGDIRALCTNV